MFRVSVELLWLSEALEQVQLLAVFTSSVFEGPSGETAIDQAQDHRDYRLYVLSTKLFLES